MGRGEGVENETHEALLAHVWVIRPSALLTGASNSENKLTLRESTGRLPSPRVEDRYPVQRAARDVRVWHRSIAP